MEITFFENVRTKIRERFMSDIGADGIKDLENILLVELGNYDIKAKVEDMVIYDGGDEELFKRYFLAKAVEGLSEGSLRTYKTVLLDFFRNVNKHIKDVLPDDIRIFLAKRKISGNTDSTLALIYRSLSSFYSWLYKEELISRNPVCKVEKIKVHRKLEKPLTDDELEMFRDKMKSLRDKAMFEFLYSTGCRVSEMVRLNRSDINTDTCEILVLGKGRKYRTVYLSVRAKYALARYLESRQDGEEALFIHDYSDWKGFELPDDVKLGRISKSGVEIRLRKYGKELGIRLHPHLLRKSVATAALKKGMTIEQVKEMLGHESIATTTLYAQTGQEDVRNAHRKYV